MRGPWYLAPADDPYDEWLAGYDGNHFTTWQEAEAAIPSLVAANPEFASVLWVPVARVPREAKEA